MSDHTQPPPEAELSIQDLIKARYSAIQQLDQHWQIEPRLKRSRLPKFLQRRAAALMRWLLKDVVEQQNAFNSIAVRALQHISAENDRRQQITDDIAVTLAHTVLDLQEVEKTLSTEVRYLRSNLQLGLQEVQEALQQGMHEVQHEMQRAVQQLQHDVQRAIQQMQQGTHEAQHDVQRAVQQLQHDVQETQRALYGVQAEQRQDQVARSELQGNMERINQAIEALRIFTSELDEGQTTIAQHLASGAAVAEQQQ